MSQVDERMSTGLPELDQVLRGLIPGDNVVWQVEDVEDYAPFVQPFCRHARQQEHRLVYFRFARHRPLASAQDGAEVIQLRPEDGFEQFIDQIHRVIKSVGRGGYYLFDCLSDLAVDWYSDQMLGNFFALTCPYLYDVEAIAYFALIRNHHSLYASGPIGETAQVVIDTLRHQGRLHVHPLKVQQRYSPTMHMLHAWEDGAFKPVTESARMTEVLASSAWRGLESATYRLDLTHRTFLAAETAHAAARAGEADGAKAQEYKDRLLRMAITRDSRLGELARAYLDLDDLLAVGRRMIGTGLIGGKSLGMLLARAILKRRDATWAEALEPHDSFYIGSDVFYTYLVQNGIWWARRQQLDPATLLEGAETARRRILVGTFPPSIQHQFSDMLDYFGQAPIIVRSSSLLEDNFGNAFAGKYESVFCVNQGPKAKRLEDFLSAVRTIYASAMSEKALIYRSQRGMLQRDEQMALLVQRVSGEVHGELYYPQMAGVALSYNPYVWNRQIDPAAGAIRLVFGLGTRAVERHDDDYTRILALNAPHKRPEASIDEVRRHAQHKVDVLDLDANQVVAKSFATVAARSPDLPLPLLASRDEELAARAAGQGIADAWPYVLTFDGLIDRTDWVARMRSMLASLQDAYGCPVEVEFTTNFRADGSYKINVVQCRPFQGDGGAVISPAPQNIQPSELVLRIAGPVIGRGREQTVDRLIYVVPSRYAALGISDRYNIARLLGQLMPGRRGGPARTTMLLGPGRWGTTTPSLGVPIRFSDIASVSVLCEIVAMREDFAPDVSLGTHLFSDMVEMDILYMALLPGKEGNVINESFFLEGPNRLTELVPAAAQWSDVVRVVDAADLPGHPTVRLHADTLQQRVICYLQPSP